MVADVVGYEVLQVAQLVYGLLLRLNLTQAEVGIAEAAHTSGHRRQSEYFLYLDELIT